MTQDVQPLTWSRRTNLEEHQQFFSKINEIIANLAPTVEEAEAAIAQATAAIASANAAVDTANAASAAADAAAQQAQTAASTVAGYDTRLTAAEGDIDAAEGDIAALQGRMGTAEGNITSLGTRMSTAETKNNQQDTDIAALQAADNQNVKLTGTRAIGNYAVLLTGNQGPIAGNKEWVGGQTFNVGGTFARPVTIKNQAMDTASTEAVGRSWIWIVDQNDQPVWILSFNQEGARRYVALRSYKSDGTYAQTLIADVTG